MSGAFARFGFGAVLWCLDGGDCGVCLTRFKGDTCVNVRRFELNHSSGLETALCKKRSFMQRPVHPSFGWVETIVDR